MGSYYYSEAVRSKILNTNEDRIELAGIRLLSNTQDGPRNFNM